jgi:hypothetical protein
MAGLAHAARGRSKGFANEATKKGPGSTFPTLQNKFLVGVQWMIELTVAGTSAD